MTKGSRTTVWVDGVAFENSQQLGIWRIFYEVMTRTSDRLDYSIWIRDRAAQPIPPGVRIALDAGRRTGHRLDLIRRTRRFLATRLPPPAGLKRADVFHSTYFTPCPCPGPAVVVNVYDMIAEQEYSRSGGTAWEANIRAKRDAIRAATLCIAISNATASDLTRFYPEVAERVRVVPLGVEHLLLEGFDRPSATPKAPYALFVGQRHGYKNFHTVLDALQAPDWPVDLKLHVVGPPLADFERRWIEVRGLAAKVVGLGRLSDANLRSQYASARCFLYPSVLEGFGLPVLEAQVNGCPAVLSDTPVFREVAGDSALFFDARLGEHLAKTVAEACQPEVRRRLVESGCENFRRYSWGRTAEHICRIYEEAASLAGRVGPRR